MPSTQHPLNTTRPLRSHTDQHLSRRTPRGKRRCPAHRQYLSCLWHTGKQRVAEPSDSSVKQGTSRSANANVTVVCQYIWCPDRRHIWPDIVTAPGAAYQSGRLFQPMCSFNSAGRIMGKFQREAACLSKYKWGSVIFLGSVAERSITYRHAFNGNSTPRALISFARCDRLLSLLRDQSLQSKLSQELLAADIWTHQKLSRKIDGLGVGGVPVPVAHVHELAAVGRRGHRRRGGQKERQRHLRSAQGPRPPL